MDDVTEEASGRTARLYKRRGTRASVRAVNQLIADVEAKRLLENKELAETIAVCLRHSKQSTLRTLSWLLDQRKLEGVPA